MGGRGVRGGGGVRGRVGGGEVRRVCRRVGGGISVWDGGDVR